MATAPVHEIFPQVALTDLGYICRKRKKLHVLSQTEDLTLSPMVLGHPDCVEFNPGPLLGEERELTSFLTLPGHIQIMRGQPQTLSRVVEVHRNDRMEELESSSLAGFQPKYLTADDSGRPQSAFPPRSSCQTEPKQQG